MSRDKLKEFNANIMNVHKNRQCKFCNLPKEAHDDLNDILDGVYMLTQFETLLYMVQEFSYDGSLSNIKDHIGMCLHRKWGPRRYRSNNGV